MEGSEQVQGFRARIVAQYQRLRAAQGRADEARRAYREARIDREREARRLSALVEEAAEGVCPGCGQAQATVRCQGTDRCCGQAFCHPCYCAHICSAWKGAPASADAPPPPAPPEARPEARPEVSTPEAPPGRVVVAASSPPVPEVDLVPVGPGHRKLADLEVRRQACAVWLLADGRHVVRFDVERFGNWDRDDLKAADYWPTPDEVAEEATAALGYLVEARDWGPVGGSDRTWELVLDAGRHHPEAWRGADLSFLPARFRGAIEKAGVKCLGELAARLEAGRWWPPKGIAAKRAHEVLDCVRAWWKDHTEEGRRGTYPAWLGAPETAPVPPAPPQPPPPPPAVRSCSRCGCTEAFACEGGCSWADATDGEDVCSSCVPLELVGWADDGPFTGWRLWRWPEGHYLASGPGRAHLVDPEMGCVVEDASLEGIVALAQHLAGVEVLEEWCTSWNPESGMLALVLECPESYAAPQKDHGPIGWHEAEDLSAWVETAPEKVQAAYAVAALAGGGRDVVSVRAVLQGGTYWVNLGGSSQWDRTTVRLYPLLSEQDFATQFPGVAVHLRPAGPEGDPYLGTRVRVVGLRATWVIGPRERSRLVRWTDPSRPKPPADDRPPEGPLSRLAREGE